MDKKSKGWHKELSAIDIFDLSVALTFTRGTSLLFAQNNYGQSQGQGSHKEAPAKATYAGVLQ